MKFAYFFQFNFFSLITLLLTPALWADPGVGVDLSFRNNKQHYEYGEPIPIKIRVHNVSDGPILINHGFKSRNFHLDLNITDPAGRLLIPKQKMGQQHKPSYHLPLPYIKHKNEPVRVAPCEVLQNNYENKDQWIKDIRQYYPLVLPGFYFVQARISAMIFKGEVCDINGDRWIGVLNSEKKQFFINGGLEVKIIPNKWKVSRVWDDQSKKMKFKLEDKNGKQLSKLRIEIKYEKGKSEKDYNLHTFYWNNKVKLKAEKWKTDWFLALAEAGKCLETMGQMEAGKAYPVSITGRLKNGMPLFGGQEIYIIKYNVPGIGGRLTDQLIVPDPSIIRSTQ